MHYRINGGSPEWRVDFAHPAIKHNASSIIHSKPARYEARYRIAWADAARRRVSQLPNMGYHSSNLLPRGHARYSPEIMA
jgi:hypothetical protein